MLAFHILIILSIFTGAIAVSKRDATDKMLKQNFFSRSVNQTHKTYVQGIQNSDNLNYPSIMFNEIRRALICDKIDNKNLGKVIPEMFNLTTENPTYKFVLPYKKPSILILHRNDFQTPNFPILSDGYVRLSRMSRKLSNNKNIKLGALNLDDIAGDLRNWQRDENDSGTTENRHLDSVSSGSQRQQFQHNVAEDPSKYKATKKSNDWSILGLDGWSGEMGELFESKNFNTGISDTIQRMPVSKSYEMLRSSILDMPTSHTIEIVDFSSKDSEAVAEFLTKELEVLSNPSHKDARTPIPTIGITKTYQDSDVFIARANDPFGYSNKWELNKNEQISTIDNRHKRSVTELYSMIKCGTGCEPLKFRGYGCYCGFLGAGRPTDSIDRCCRLHDKCYGQSECPSYLEYFVPYIWKCFHGRPLCALDHGEWGGVGSCASELCKCDLALSKCLRKFVCPKKRSVCRSSAARMLQNILTLV